MQRPDIRWWEYEEALEEARRQRKPVLLSLTAAWCSTDPDPVLRVASGSDPGDGLALADVARQFVLARVDVERRPDVYRRYQPADLPAALLLRPDGDVLLGSDVASRPLAGRPGDGGQAGLYLPPPVDAAPTSALRTRDAASRGGVAPEAGAALPAVDLRPTVSDVEGALLLSFDEAHGGFGPTPKHPEAYALAYAVDRYQASGSERWHDVFNLSLDGITRGLFDAGSGGFYRSAGRRDWQEPNTAKLLGINAELIRAYVRAYEVTQRTGYLDVANRSLQFALAVLRGPAFFGSVAPSGQVDRTIYLPPNEEMVGTLCLAAQVTGESRYSELAWKAQRFLLERMFDPERGFAHYHDGAPRLHGLLLDNAAALVGLARTYAALFERDYLVVATRTADLILRTFLGESDRAGQALWPPGGLAFEDGTLAAEGLLSLSRLTGSPRYYQFARRLAVALAAGLAGQRAGPLARYGTLVHDLSRLEAEPGSAGKLGTTRQEWGSGR